VNNNNNNEIQQGLTWPALTTGWCLKYGPVKYKIASNWQSKIQEFTVLC